MTNELLTLAAKAAGLTYTVSNHGVFLIAPHINPRAKVTWNPLTDDGDALRLAVKLQMRVGVGYVDRVMGQMIGYFEGDNVEPMADTRLAIVRAAAEFGKGM